jgi:acyl-CoA synthetase (AMP-forming)/AMP-acid ligase II/NAD(P)-dependent dehydrogenase (short-subunit alcohol dehydrogenase family)
MDELDSGEWRRPSWFTRALSWVLNPHGAPSARRLRAAISGKRVLITGASFGIGAASARLFAAAGATVLLVARSRNELEALAAAIRASSGAAEAYPADLTDPSEVAALAAQLVAAHGPVDVVVNNAGKSIRRSIALQTDRFHDYERTIGVNYLGPVRLLLALLPAMRHRKSGQIINVSTFGVRVPPGPRWGAYQASKSAFDVWFRGMGVEVRGDGVRTTSIYLPLVYTRMSAPTPSLRGLPGLTPEQAAGLIARAVVRQPRVIAPWWLFPTELLSVVFRRPMEWLSGILFRRSTDSPSALGLPPTEPEPARKPSLRRALRDAGLLTHNPRILARMGRTILVDGGRPSSLCALAAMRHPDQPALIDDEGIVTYGELHGRVRKLAWALRERFGIGPERALAIMCRNHRGFVEALLAGSALGADLVFLNTEFPGPQLAQVLTHHPLGCVIHDQEFTPAFESAGFAGPHVVVGAGAGALSLTELIQSGAESFRGPRRQGKIIILTSGTTGVPKGAGRTLKYRALSGPLTTLLTKTPLHARTTILVTTPLFHGFGLAYLALALLLGATLVVRRRTTPEGMLADIARHRVEVLIAVPALYQRLLDVPAAVRSEHDLSSLRAALSSGAPLGGEFGSRFMAAFGPCLFNLYGSSETGFGAIATPADLLAAPGTVGYPPIGTAIRILDPDGNSLPAGRVGRVFVQTGLVFAGYVGGGNKERVDGFTSTGDLGHLDAAGRLFIDGRADDMIVSGGENVFPLEVEEVLASHPAVAEAAVIGVPDEQFGQRLRAFVVLRAGAFTSEEDLRAYLKERIARFKAPRDFIFLPHLPRNAVGKVLKRALPAN